MSEFKLPLPRRLLRFETLDHSAVHHDDTLIGRDVLEFDEVAAIESSPFATSDLLLVIDALVDELTVVDELSISLTLIEQVEQVDERVAEVA